jgi:hypothetical protein
MIKKIRKGGGRLVVIDNVHVDDCGSPPSIDATDKYVGYFENPYGEQWVFIGDPKTGEAVIRGGDAGWMNEHKISLKSPCPDIFLNEPEKMWIITCFMGMCYKPFDEVVDNYNKAAKRLSEEIQKRLKEETP